MGLASIQLPTPVDRVRTASNIIMSSWKDLFDIEHSACAEKDASCMTCYLEVSTKKPGAATPDS